MFEFVRKHTRLALGAMLLLIIPSFVFFGVQGYAQFNDASNDKVAQVDGQSITRAEWDEAHKRYVDQLRRQSPNMAAADLETPLARSGTLDALVRDRLLLAAANDLHLYPSDTRMARLFDSDPQYAGLRGPDGRISRDLLAMQGMTPAIFDQRLRQELGVKQVLGGITQTVAVPAAAASAALEAFLQRRTVQLQRFDPAVYRARIQPTDADIEAHYKGNEAQFRAPEQATIEYVMLDIEAISRGITLSDDEIRKGYADSAVRYTVPEERRSSHILIGIDKDKPAADKTAARGRAEALLAQVRQNPLSFAEVAKKNSTDPGSAANGGDLDFHPRGDMTPPFDDAVFKLKQGEISGVVETDFGYHVIQLTGIRGGQVKPFESVRSEVEAELRKAAAQRRWSEAAEQFTNTAYEQSDSLQPLVDKLKLEKKTATVQRIPAPGASGPLASRKLLDAVFGDEAVRNKRNTDAVEVAANQLVAARVLQHVPARTLPMAEVKDRVRDRLIDVQSAALARQEGQGRVAALRAGPASDPLPVVLTVSRGQAQGMPRPLLDTVLRADPAKLPVVEGVDLAEQGYVVLRVMEVLPREAAPGGDDPLKAQYAQAWATAEADAYLAALKLRYKAEVKPVAAPAGSAATADAGVTGASGSAR